MKLSSVFSVAVFRARSLFLIFALLWTGSAGSGCGAIYPEVKTAIRPGPEDSSTLSPAPPQDLYFFSFERATVRHKDRAGQPWAGGGPNTYARLLIDDVAGYTT
ncbi:MAG: hypothetical protein MK135_15640, partial [Polyangiaceae bacterium]|nr:hypothetical protein [Polyangiaceae bacterium]